MMVRTLVLVLVMIGIARVASADAISPDSVPPGHQVLVTGMDAFADRAFVNVRTRPPISHGDHDAMPIASYTLVNEFPVDLPERLCAVPSSWVMDSPVGGLGTRMLRGARGASGDVVTDPAFITELLALFESPEVACAPLLSPPQAGGGIERVVDTVRVAGIDGTTLRFELVEVAYQVRGAGLVTVPAPAGATTRPPLPAAPASSCACRAGAPASGGRAAGLAGLGVVALVVARRRRHLG